MSFCFREKERYKVHLIAEDIFIINQNVISEELKKRFCMKLF